MDDASNRWTLEGLNASFCPKTYGSSLPPSDYLNLPIFKLEDNEKETSESGERSSSTRSASSSSFLQKASSKIIQCLLSHQKKDKNIDCSRSLCILLALWRLGRIPILPMDISKKSNYHFFILGADSNEGNSPATTIPIFEPLINTLTLVYNSSLSPGTTNPGNLNLMFSLIGPNVLTRGQHTSTLTSSNTSIVTTSKTIIPKKVNSKKEDIEISDTMIYKTTTVTIRYIPEIYDPISHNKIEATDNHSNQILFHAAENVPVSDLFIAFNAGVWGYETWLPTIYNVLTQRQQQQSVVDNLPPKPQQQSKTALSPSFDSFNNVMVITSYNRNEAEDDHDCIEDFLFVQRKTKKRKEKESTVGCDVQFLWKFEKTPFPGECLTPSSNPKAQSSLPQTENDYWMCLLGRFKRVEDKEEKRKVEDKEERRKKDLAET
eukprot:g3796.t1